MKEGHFETRPALLSRQLDQLQRSIDKNPIDRRFTPRLTDNFANIK
ncbi:hypothetical protein Vpro01_01919 [Vibrio proteolyticus]